MKKHQRLWLVALMIGLCLVSVVSAAGGALGVSAESVANSPDRSLAYENPEFGEVLSLSGSCLRTNAGFSEPTAAEKSYLDGRRELTFSYTALIPNGMVNWEYRADEGRVEVIAVPYSYRAKNGETVCWYPTEASLTDETQALEETDGTYRCVFSDRYHTEDFALTVSYRWDAALSPTVSEELVLSGYREGEKALKAQTAYRTATEAYAQKAEAYAAYTAYLAELEPYLQYCAELEAYRTADEAYRQYLNACTEYEQQMTAYEARQKYEEELGKYFAYQKLMQENLEQYNEYLIYQNAMEAIGAKLNVLETLFTTDSNGWNFYNSLMGNLVARVVAERAKLIAAGCDAATIDAAGESAVQLRELMSGYSALREAEYASEYLKTAALYGYYTEHYIALRDAFCRLYGSLKALTDDNSFLPIKLREEGKLEHFLQYVGQLYVTATCLDDREETGNRISGWTLLKKPLEALVEDRQRLADGGEADPSQTPLPLREVGEVTLPEKVEPPAYEPPDVEKPILPTPVSEPTPPKQVERPAEVAAAEEPGEPPVSPVIDESARLLAEEVQAGTLTPGTFDGAERTLSFFASVSVPVSIENKKTVTFYNADGTILDCRSLEYGASVTYDYDAGGLPKRQDDVQYSYRFIGWRDQNGNPAKLPIPAESSLSFYAEYEQTIRSYPVSFTLDGVTRTIHCKYGETPICPISVTPPPASAEYTYAFSGWSPEIVAVTGEANYTGSFVKSKNRYEITWIVDEVTVVTVAEYGEMPSYPGSLEREPDDFVYSFAGWTSALRPVTGNGVYVASPYKKTPIATSLQGKTLSVTHLPDAVRVKMEQEEGVWLDSLLSFVKGTGKALEVESDGLILHLDAADLATLEGSFCKQIRRMKKAVSDLEYTSFAFCDSMGKDLNPSVFATVCAGQTAPTGAAVWLESDDGKRIGTEGSVPFDGALYAVRVTYPVKTQANPDCNVMGIPKSAAVGERVDLCVDCEFGYEIAGAEVTLADGGKVPTEGLSFRMPEGAVSVRLITNRIVYHVTFLVNGAEYATGEYALGETVVPPDDPVIEGDGQFVYTFRNWTPAVTIAAGENRNPIYSAVFTKMAVTNEDPLRPNVNNDRLLTVYLPIAGTVILAGIALVVFLIRRKKKQRIAIGAQFAVGEIQADAVHPAEESVREESVREESVRKESAEASDLIDSPEETKKESTPLVRDASSDESGRETE